ncbi:MAG: PAS domain S-box protein [Thermoplasmatota archaeon]
MSPKGTSTARKAEMDDSERMTMDRFPMGLMVIDSKGQIEFLNKILSDQLDLKREKVQGTLVFDILEPSSIPDVLSLIRSEKKYVKELNLILHPPTGRMVHGAFMIEEYPLPAQKGFLMILKEQKTRAVKKEIGFEVLEDLPIPVTILNRDLEPVFQNSSTDEWIVLPSKGKDPISKPGKERKGKLMECLASGKTVNFTVQVKTSEDPLEFDITAVPLPSKIRPDQVMEIWLPRTSEVEKKKEKHGKGIGQEIIETANAVIIGLDMEGNIILFNNGASRVLGFTFEEVKGTSWFDYLVDKEDQAGKLEVFQWSIGSGFRTQYETRVRSNSGATLAISLENSIIFDRSGNVNMVLMIGQDITKMKRLEESLREQSEKLVNAMDEITLYNDLMIHDIHNANAGIMGYLELLNIEGIGEDKRKKYITRALNEVSKSSSIIKDVKVMSLAKPGPERNPVDLLSVFETATRKTREEWGDRCPKIEMDIPDLHILADDLLEEGLMRVLLNIIHRGAGKGSKVKISAKRDPSRSNLVPEPVHIIISDDLGNVGEDEIKRVLDRPRSTDKGSHGLGLYLVKKIIERFGGMIWVDNSDGKRPGISVHLILSEAV